MYKGSSESDVSYFIISCSIHTLYVNIHKHHYRMDEGTFIFLYSPHFCQQSSSTFEQQHMFPSSKCFCPSCTATMLMGCISKPKQAQIWLL